MNTDKHTITHYQNVLRILEKEIEIMVDNKRSLDELNKDDIDLLYMSIDIFNEFLDDFKNQISFEEQKRIEKLNTTIGKIINFYNS